jgi:A1 cistron-splicing factor AAR2
MAENRQITPEEALELYPKSGILILLDLPEKMVIGFDNIRFEVSDKFKGFKLIPPGCHFLYVTDHTTEGEFLWVEAGEVIVKQWAGDSMDSDLIWRKCDDKDKAENLIIGAKNMELDPFLAAYQY